MMQRLIHLQRRQLGPAGPGINGRGLVGAPGINAGASMGGNGSAKRLYKGAGRAKAAGTMGRGCVEEYREAAAWQGHTAGASLLRGSKKLHAGTNGAMLGHPAGEF